MSNAAQRPIIDEKRQQLVLDLGGNETVLDPSGVLFFPQIHLLVVADLHLEKGSSQARRGRFLPPYDSRHTLLRLARVIEEYNPRHVISLGDSMHDDAGWSSLDDFSRNLLQNQMENRHWTWICGNHDPQKPMDFPGQGASSLQYGNLAFCHQPGKFAGKEQAGDVIEISGHLHPSARIIQRGKSLRRPAFVSDGRRLIMPAFGAYTGGLSLRNIAFAAVLDLECTRAFLLGRERVHAVSYRQLA